MLSLTLAALAFTTSYRSGPCYKKGFEPWAGVFFIAVCGDDAGV